MDILNVKNGLINIRTGEFKVHDPNFLSLVQLPVPYNHKAHPKKIIIFMYNVLDPSDVPLMLEYIGYCLVRTNKLQKDLMCVGYEDNGKSVMLKVITKLLGRENISSKTLHSLVSERFVTANLFGKLANIFADLSSKRLQDVEAFKVLTSGDRIVGAFGHCTHGHDKPRILNRKYCTYPVGHEEISHNPEWDLSLIYRQNL
jgi:putative DNA primase/helicase